MSDTDFSEVGPNGQPQIEDTPNGQIPNTPVQEAVQRAAELAWEDERGWPLHQVIITGDEVEWEPRMNPDYWVTNEDGSIEPRDDVKVSENGKVLREAEAVVICRARNEDHAKMLALRDNPTYHTVVKVIVEDKPAF